MRRPEMVLARLQTHFLGGFGGDKESRRARVDQEVERPLAVDPDANQEVVGIRKPVRNPERPADLWVARAALCLPVDRRLARRVRVKANAVVATVKASRQVNRAMAAIAFFPVRLNTRDMGGSYATAAGAANVIISRKAKCGLLEMGV